MLRAAEALCAEMTFQGRPLIEDPLAQSRLARAHANVEASRMLGYRAMWARKNNQAHPAYGPMAKMFSSERFLASATDLLNLTAPLSLSKQEGPAGYLNLSYRHAHGTRIYGGTSQVHRSIIAERFLNLPRSRIG
jgi:alkylation response protein AidB-like acyl-CoA dehydrogenase